MSVPDPTAGEREPSPSTLWPHGPIVGHPKHDYYVCGSCHQPLAPGPCPAKVPTQPDPPTFDSLLSDPTQQLDSEGVVIASIPAPDPTAGERPREWWEEYTGDRYWLALASPPAVAASTGTSEDVEARLRHHLRATTGGLGVADLDALLAAREAAARAEALRDALAEWEGGPTGQAPIPRWWLEDRIAREVRP